MCIAIVKMPGENDISKQVLENCAENNPDGCGFAYINTDYHGVSRLKTWKGMDFNDFYHQYNRAKNISPESPFLIHFRIKTHGDIDTDNCHPFNIDNDKVFIHNGIITGVGTDVHKSDTQLFNEKILKGLPDDWFYNESIKTLIEDFIGFSKLAVLTIDGDVDIFNEEKGTWIGGNWFSNTSYKKRVKYTPPQKPAYQGATRGDWRNRYHNDDDDKDSIQKKPKALPQPSKNHDEIIGSVVDRAKQRANAELAQEHPEDDIHDLKDMDECDWCGKFEENLMITYIVDGEGITLCDTCSAELKDNGIISASDIDHSQFDNHNQDDYYDEMYGYYDYNRYQ